jgi:hypothetical protein
MKQQSFLPDDITLILERISRHYEAYSIKDHHLVFNPIGWNPLNEITHNCHESIPLIENITLM